jgi:hypothetical protein
VKTLALSSEVTFDLTLPTMESTPPSEDKTTTSKGGETACSSRPKEDRAASLKGDGAARSSHELYWESTIPSDGGLAVVTPGVMTLAVTLATQMRMRVKDEVRFKLALPEGVQPTPSAMKLLEMQLSALAKHETAGNDGEQQVSTEQVDAA